MHTVDLVILWVAVVGQVSFVLLWLTQRWWATTVGQALMVKAFSLGLILTATLWANYRGPLDEVVGRGLFIFLAVGITSQTIALAFEIIRARRRSGDWRDRADRTPPNRK